MIRNYYPVKYQDFLRIKSVGNYVIMYCELEDRIHFEMAVENSIYVTQRFKNSIEEELEIRASNHSADRIKTFLKMTLSGNTFYRYHPSDQQKKELKSIKLYDKIVIRETTQGEYDPDQLTIIESDTYMKAMDGDEVVLFGEKQ